MAQHRRSSWLDRWDGDRLDVLIAAVMGAFLLIAYFTADTTADYPREADALGAAIDVAAIVALARRRHHPVPVFALTWGASVVSYLRGYPDHGLPLLAMLAIYTVGARCERRTTVTSVAVLVVSLVIGTAIRDVGDLNPGVIVGNSALFIAAAIWGDRKQVRDAYAEQLELRAAEKERERLEAAERAVEAERARIARELHDVVAHAMSVVAVQSGVGAHVIDQRPDEAKRILETINATSRDALTEMRRLLGVLRSDPSSPAERAPSPGLHGLDELAERVRTAGLPVEVTVEGDRAAVPPGVDLAAYRIVQEALTNVLKHAGTASAQVRVRCSSDEIDIEVLDDGRGASASGSRTASGHGLVGMRERAALYDGRFDAGPRVGGGYRVAATLRFTPTTQAQTA